MARHKAPSAFARATRRIAPPLHALHLRRTGGTVVALSAVVLAGAAGNGSQTSAADESASPQPATQRPSADVTRAAGERAARATEASRSRPRETRSQVLLAERRDHDSSPAVGRTGAHTAQAENPPPADPRAVARSMLAHYGWDAGEFSCLDQLWVSESDWETHATNPTSGAYGIPQALPPEKMASAGSDWRTNPATQIEWGLRYIDLSYGTPCSAWEFKQANDWY